MINSRKHILLLALVILFGTYYYIANVKEENTLQSTQRNKNKLDLVTEVPYLNDKNRTNIGPDKIAIPLASEKLTNNLVHLNIRTNYSVRNPKNKDLLKLYGKLLDLEPASDPLLSSAKCGNQMFLTVFILSSPKNFLRRQFIRDTWGNSYLEDIKLLKVIKPLKEDILIKNMFKTVFVMGHTKDGTHMNKVHEEAKFSKDIVFGSLQEDYRNLTMKTRLGLKWAFYECDSKYILKTDDDVFVNPVKLVEWLKNMPRTNFYTGWCNFGADVVRNRKSKWYISVDDFKGDTYPGYCLGGGYLMSNDVVGKVISASYGRKLFPMEDLYVGLMINEMEEVKIKNMRGHFDLVYEGRSKDCDLNELFLAHPVTGYSLVNHIKRSRKALTMCS